MMRASLARALSRCLFLLAWRIRLAPYVRCDNMRGGGPCSHEGHGAWVHLDIQIEDAMNPPEECENVTCKRWVSRISW